LHVGEDQLREARDRFQPGDDDRDGSAADGRREDVDSARRERQQPDGRQQHGDIEKRECLRGAPYEAGSGDERDDDGQERASRDTPPRESDGERDGDGDQCQPPDCGAHAPRDHAQEKIAADAEEDAGAEETFRVESTLHHVAHDATPTAPNRRSRVR
jgi:hypothetical protein